MECPFCETTLNEKATVCTGCGAKYGYRDSYAPLTIKLAIMLFFVGFLLKAGATATHPLFGFLGIGLIVIGTFSFLHGLFHLKKSWWRET